MKRTRHDSAFEWMARIGYAARGIVFLILGGLMALAASAGTRAGDTKVAFHTILVQPLGEIILAAVAGGLVCFAVWRLAQGLLDADHCGTAPKSLARRAAQTVAALFYLGFAADMAGMILGWNSSASSDQVAHDWTAWLLAQSFGRWLIAAVGLAIMVTGLSIGIAGCIGKFERRLDLKKKPRRLITIIGGFGVVVRALVLALIGVFVLFAAVNANSRDAKGLAGALAVIQDQPYGALLLGFTATGLIAFGLYEIAEAAYRRVTAPTVRQAAVKAGLKT